MEQLHSLRNHLLIAMPQLRESWFEGTVTYLCEHNDEGAMGLVLNKELPLGFAEVCEQLEIPLLAGVNPTVLNGGPVSPEQGFILHQEQGNWNATLNITEQTHLSSSSDVLRAIAAASGPRHFRLALGYAGWSAGQLEQELLDNAWLTVPADTELLFQTPVEHLYQAALGRLGVKADYLSNLSGHA
jgi:putative transcriptional regulator